jgi:hypothetical protein
MFHWRKEKFHIGEKKMMGFFQFNFMTDHQHFLSILFMILTYIFLLSYKNIYNSFFSNKSFRATWGILSSFEEGEIEQFLATFILPLSPPPPPSSSSPPRIKAGPMTS